MAIPRKGHPLLNSPCVGIGQGSSSQAQRSEKWTVQEKVYDQPDIQKFKPGTGNDRSNHQAA